jgi:hypothetical protein
MKKWAGILFAWWYVVAPAATVRQPDGRMVSWPAVLEGPYIEETQCKRRAEAISKTYGVTVHCEESEILREMRGAWRR